MSAEIKPCPFCGGEGQHLSVFSTAREQTDLYRIQCQGTCGVCGPVRDGREAASFAWNQRHFQIPSSVRDVLVENDAEIAKLREALDDARRSVRNARGAVESNQVVDKDVHGTLTGVIARIDAALAGGSDASA